MNVFLSSRFMGPRVLSHETPILLRFHTFMAAAGVPGLTSTSRAHGRAWRRFKIPGAHRRGRLRVPEGGMLFLRTPATPLDFQSRPHYINSYEPPHR